ncbi:hypothetical protein E4U34_005327 [Claviceps purpurea]|nr:hypothetical protein E4U34_005327 [Claviceps purpurea]
MANILSILIATLAVVSPLAQAGACVPGLEYCGHTLATYGMHETLLNPDLTVRLRSEFD